MGRGVVLNVSPKAAVVKCNLLGMMNAGPRMVAVKIVSLHGCNSRCLGLHHVFRQIINVVRTCLPSRLTVRTPFFKGGIRSVLGLKETRKITVTTTLDHSVPVARCTPLGVGVTVANGKRTDGRRITSVLGEVLRVPRDSVLPFVSTASKLTTTCYRCLRVNEPALAGRCSN